MGMITEQMQMSCGVVKEYSPKRRWKGNCDRWVHVGCKGMRVLGHKKGNPTHLNATWDASVKTGPRKSYKLPKGIDYLYQKHNNDLKIIKLQTTLQVVQLSFHLIKQQTASSACKQHALQAWLG